MGKKKRKLSSYQVHMSRELKGGKTFKAAVASWKSRKGGGNPRKKSAPTNPTRRRSSIRMPKRRFRRGAAALKPMDYALGAVAYSMAEPVLDGLAGRFGIGLSDELVKIAIGAYAYKKSKNKVIKGASVAAMIIGVNRMVGGGFAMAGVKTGTALTASVR